MKIPQTYQEVEVWFVIPVIRAELAKAMIEQGFNQKETAKLMGLTEAAISNYMKGKRARSKIKFNDKITKEIKKSALKLMESKTSLSTEMQRIICLVKKSGLICSLHKAYNKSVNKNCCICSKEHL